MSTECEIRYNGKGQPPHLEKFFRLKGDIYESGKTYPVPSARAGLLQRSCPEGTIEILSGTPTYEQPVPARVKAAARADADIRKRFPVEPAAALASVGSLPKKLVEQLKVTIPDPDAVVKAIDDGTHDKDLAGIAVLAKLLGVEKVARTAVRRAEAVAIKAAGA